MTYRLSVKPSVEREFDRLPRSVQRRVIDALAKIESAPRGPGTVKMAGSTATYRFRVGEWRIVYEIDDAPQRVFVTIVAHRREVYRRS